MSETFLRDVSNKAQAAAPPGAGEKRAGAARRPAEVDPASEECERAANEALSAVGFFFFGGRASGARPDDSDAEEEEEEGQGAGDAREAGVRLRRCPPEDAAVTAECIFQMCKQRQKDLEFREAAADAQRRMCSDVQLAEARCAKLERRLEQKERELSCMSRQLNETEEQAGAEIEKLRRERSELAKVQAQQRQRQAQLVHESKKHERAYSKLQEKLGSLLSSSDKGGLAGTGRAPEKLIGCGGAAAGGSRSRSIGAANRASSSSASQQEFYRNIVGTYETKQRELVLENGDLRASLRALEAEHRQLMNEMMTMEAEHEAHVQAVTGEDGLPISISEIASMRHELRALKLRERGMEDEDGIEDEPPEYDAEDEDEDEDGDDEVSLM